MRPPRFRVRTLMIAVAASGLLCYAAILWSRSDDLGYRAAFHSAREAYYRSGAQQDARWIPRTRELLESARTGRLDDLKRLRARWGESGRYWSAKAQWDQVVQQVEGDLASLVGRRDDNLRMAAYHGMLRAKYERGARSPWRPVAPDPPPPPGIALGPVPALPVFFRSHAWFPVIPSILMAINLFSLSKVVIRDIRKRRRQVRAED
jgi:hypothetical protein